MGRQEMLFNPVMEEVDEIKTPLMPYEEDKERTNDPYRFDKDQNDMPLFTDKKAVIFRRKCAAALLRKTSPWRHSPH